MSSATNVLSNSSHNTQVAPLIKPDNETREHLNSAFVPTTHESKSAQINEYQQKKEQRFKKKKSTKSKDEKRISFPNVLLSYENLRILTEIEVNFTKYDKLLSSLKFQFYH